MEKELIIEVLSSVDNHIIDAAKILGMSKSSLEKKLIALFLLNY